MYHVYAVSAALDLADVDILGAQVNSGFLCAQIVGFSCSECGFCYIIGPCNVQT